MVAAVGGDMASGEGLRMSKESRRRAAAIRWRGRLRKLRGNPVFEWFTVAVIILSSLSVGAKTYAVPPLLLQVLDGLDTLVTLYFLCEIIVRYIAAGGARNFFRGGWNIFDFFIVAVSLIPINESEYALLARLLRLFRVMRLIFFVPQLRSLVLSLLTAIPRIGYVALMMFVIFYIYGAAGNLLFGEINGFLWGNIGAAMLTLFRVATFEDWTDVMYETMEVYPLSWIYFLSFIFLAAFVFLNMMIGVVISVMHEDFEKQKGGDDDKKRLARMESRLARIEESITRNENNSRDGGVK